MADILTSILDLATVLCFLLLHWVKLPPKMAIVGCHWVSIVGWLMVILKSLVLIMSCCLEAGSVKGTIHHEEQ